MKKLLFIFIIIVLIAISGFGYKIYEGYEKLTLKEDKTIEIEKGKGLYSILTDLGYNYYFLKIYFEFYPDKIVSPQMGKYTLKKGDNLDLIIKNISKGSVKDNLGKKITINEGLNIFDIDEKLENEGFIKKGDFIKEAKNVEKYKKNYPFLGNALSLEGFLYPDTYYVDDKKFSKTKFIHQMLENFKTSVFDTMLEGKSEKEIIDIVNMASIIERESKNNEEKPIIAGILLKRIDEGWQIGADITACYAHEYTSSECRNNLSKVIYDKNDYNTRTKKGLPKTPINNPYIESIKAVLNPETTEYYYYLHGADGKIYYGRNTQEHENNKVHLKK